MRIHAWACVKYVFVQVPSNLKKEPCVRFILGKKASYIFLVEKVTMHLISAENLYFLQC